MDKRFILILVVAVAIGTGAGWIIGGEIGGETVRRTGFPLGLGKSLTYTIYPGNENIETGNENIGTLERVVNGYGIVRGETWFTIETTYSITTDNGKCSGNGLLRVDNQRRSRYFNMTEDKITCQEETEYTYSYGETNNVHVMNEVKGNPNAENTDTTVSFSSKVLNKYQGFELFDEDLSTNYSKSFLYLSDGTASEVTASVEEISTVETPAGDFECYKVVTTGEAPTFWISKDKNRVVKMTASSPIEDGSKITMVLENYRT